MESVDLDMGEIFDDDGDDDDIGALAPLADLPEATQSQENEDEDNVEVLARLKDLSEGAAKKVVRKPQPKLDPTRLTGERGIPILPKVFEKVKLKGKGHEAQDLGVIMRYMEHWTHRLFPKMPFDEVIERVERLGNKKEVQTCVKKMRLDMPILNDEFVGSDKEDGDDDEVRSDGDGEQQKKSSNIDDMWDDLLRDEADIPADFVTQVSSSGHIAVSQSDPIPQVATTPAVKTQINTSSVLTPEMVERMEKNKQLAREKRLKKMGIFSPMSQPSQSSQSVASFQQSANSQLSQTQKSTNMITPDRDSEMSEVLAKGISQNIQLENKNQPDAQNWCTEPANATETEGCMTELDPTQKQLTETESMEVCKEKSVIGNNVQDRRTSLDKERFSASEETCTNMDEMSGFIEKQDCNKLLTMKPYENILTNHVEDSEEMSEVIEKQDFKMTKKSNLVEKTGTAANNLEEDKENSETVNEIQPKSIKYASNEAERTTLSNKTVDAILNNEDDEFDDDLTEDQLMEALEQ